MMLKLGHQIINLNLQICISWWSKQNKHKMYVLVNIDTNLHEAS